MSDIRFVTSYNALDALIKKAIQILYERIQYNLNYLGNKCIVRIRDRSGSDSWYDQTGNLRSSIGYAIYSHGQKEIESAFNVVKDGQKGAQEGKKMVEELSTKYSDTFALVVIAAMEYAEYVEAMESKDVLASTELYAKKEIGRYLQKAIREAEKKIQEIEVSL